MVAIPYTVGNIKVFCEYGGKKEKKKKKILGGINNLSSWLGDLSELSCGTVHTLNTLLLALV